MVSFSDAAAVVSQPPEIQQEAVARRRAGKERTLRAAAKRIGEEIREQADAATAKEVLSMPVTERVRLVKSEVGDLRRHVEAGTVDAILAFPPTEESHLDDFKALSNFASHALAPDGIMAVIVNPRLMLRIANVLPHENVDFITELDYRCPERPSRSTSPLPITVRRWPVLLFGKERFKLQPGPDSITEPASDEVAGPTGPERLLEAGLGLLVARLVRPGQTVCDPITLGRSGIVLGALAHGCRFIGAADRQHFIDRIWARVAASETALQKELR